MKKVMLVNTVAGKGSVGRIVNGLSSELKERGAKTLIAYGRGDRPEGHDSFRIGSNKDVYIHGALSRISDRHGLYSEKATRALIGKIEEFDPDIIHLHNVHGYYVNYRLLFSFLKNSFSGEGKRIMWTLHDCWSFTGHCVHYEYACCTKWKSGCHDCPEKAQYPKSLLMDGSRENYRLKKEAFTGLKNLTLITPSKWLKEQLSESFLSGYPVFVIPTGIDLSAFRKRGSDIRERYGIGDKTLLLGAANPWRERKGFDDFLKLAGKTGDDTVIAMIGLNKKQLATVSGYKNIIGIMKTDSVEEMAEWYSAADIYVNLTYEDTFPTTNLEAMACGTPVITYRAGGSPESITPETGAVTEVGNITRVIESVDRLLSSDPVETEKHCISRASEYASDIRFRQYLDEVYKI